MESRARQEAAEWVEWATGVADACDPLATWAEQLPERVQKLLGGGLGMIRLPMRCSLLSFQRQEAGPMPQFQIEGEAEIFDNADEIDIHGEIARYSFVTAEKSAGDDKTVIISLVDPKDLSEFEGLLFQIDVNEEEDVVILRQVQMFFWPWEDDEEFEEMDSPD
ncbi:MAG: hypothetical protein ACKO4T_01985 [Planctomycetaceae bacterium]